MEKVGEEEEKTIGEATEESRSDKEDERIRDTIGERFVPVDYTEEGSKDPSNSQTVNFEDHVSEYEMEDEEVLELFRRDSAVRAEVAKSNNVPYLNKSEEMVLQFQEDTPAETEETNVVFHSTNDSSEVADQGTENMNSSVILEGARSSSDSEEGPDDSSSDSDHDSSLSRYYFDGSLPLSAHVEEPETNQDESPVPKDENQVHKSKLNAKLANDTSLSISNNSVVALAFLVCLLRH